MPIQFQYDETLIDPSLLDGVWKLLCRYDIEFIPPLSAREYTYQSDLTVNSAGNQDPIRYFETLKKQSFLLAQDGDKVIGFMSFRPHYICED